MVALSSNALAAIFVDEYERDSPLVAMPRAEVHVVVRFGTTGAGDVDVHAFGVFAKARRKVIRSGQRAVTARLRLGAVEAVLGVPASALAGRVVALDDVWGAARTRRLLDQLAATKTTREAARIVETAIAEPVVGVRDARQGDLARRASELLATARVGAVADELGVSERHLRRVFREAIGVGPKTFAKLARFHRALRRAAESRRVSWASIAVAAGYYDQAHLIDEFRAIAGVTPRALLDELGGRAPR